MGSKIVPNAVNTTVQLPYKAQHQPQLELQSPVMRSLHTLSISTAVCTQTSCTILIWKS